MNEVSSADVDGDPGIVPARPAWDVAELALLQAGLVLLAVYFGLGVTTDIAYAWPLLMGPGPFFSLFCLYLATQLPRRSRHLYGLVRFATVYSVPYAAFALVSGHSVNRGPFNLGDLPPILLSLALVLRLRAWRRLFDGPLADHLDERRALLIELFAGFGTCSLLMCCLFFLSRLDNWARTTEGGVFIPIGNYILTLVRVMVVPSFAATVIGWGLYRSRGARPWVRAAIVFLVVMVVIHAGMQAYFAKSPWSRISAATWTMVLVGFAAWVGRWHRHHAPAPLPGAPHVF